MSVQRAATLLGSVLGALLWFPSPAAAHGISQRSDLPIPEWLFGWAAVVVLIASFVALAALWPSPKLEQRGWRPLPGWLGRALASRPVDVLCGAIGAVLLGLVVWSGLVGQQVPSANFAPTFVYVVVWVGLVPASALFGDIFRAFNPWRALARAVTRIPRRLAGQPLPTPLTYPKRLGRWPAVAGLLCFVWLELASQSGDVPRTVALATLGYSAVAFLGMALFGIETWIARAEAFSVYFNLFSRLSPFERRGDRVGLRRPLSGLARLDAQPGTVALLCVMIGTVSYDGASEGRLWRGIGLGLGRALESLGLSATTAAEVAATVGLAAAILLAYALYRLGAAGASSVGGALSARRLSGAFAHSLVPIALVYALAHYLTLLLFQGQAIVYLASDPLGSGTDLFGTANRPVDYTVIGGATVWYLQVAFVVAGHVAALTLAHDRALVLYERARTAVRSQYWMLAVMVGYTLLALWLLSQANA